MTARLSPERLDEQPHSGIGVLLFEIGGQAQRLGPCLRDLVLRLLQLSLKFLPAVDDPGSKRYAVARNKD